MIKLFDRYRKIRFFLFGALDSPFIQDVIIKKKPAENVFTFKIKSLFNKI